MDIRDANAPVATATCQKGARKAFREAAEDPLQKLLLAMQAAKSTNDEREFEALFSEFYNTHKGLLADLIRKIIPNIHSRQDVLQDVLIKILGNIDKFNPERGAAISWISRLTQNIAITHWRKQELRKDTPTGMAPLHALPYGNSTPSSGIERWENKAVIINGLLPALDNELWATIACTARGLNIAQGARSQGMPFNTYKRRLQTACDQLGGKICDSVSAEKQKQKVANESAAAGRGYREVNMAKNFEV